MIGNSAYSNTTSTTTLLGIVGLWADRDVGTPNATGGAAFSNNTYTVSGSGNDIFNASDNFHYVYQPLMGDGTIIAHVLSQGNANAAAKAGVMIRESLNANSTFADVVATPASGILFQDRATTGASAAGSSTRATLTPRRSRLTGTVGCTTPSPSPRPSSRSSSRLGRRRICRT